MDGQNPQTRAQQQTTKLETIIFWWLVCGAYNIQMPPISQQKVCRSLNAYTTLDRVGLTFKLFWLLSIHQEQYKCMINSRKYPNWLFNILTNDDVTKEEKKNYDEH